MFWCILGGRIGEFYMVKMLKEYKESTDSRWENIILVLPSTLLPIFFIFPKLLKRTFADTRPRGD